MLVTGNGVMLTVLEDEDDLRALFDALDALFPETLEDTIADHALDTICFLQDADVSTPMDAFMELPWAEAPNLDFDLMELPAVWLFAE